MKNKLSEKYEGKENRIILGNYNEAPKYMQLNEYIKYGYRINCNTIKKSLKSLFIIHNESVNIWSHLIGTFLVIFLIFYTNKYITIYNYQLNNIRLNIIEIKKYTQYLFKIDNRQIKDFAKNLFNFSKNILNSKYIKPKQLYIKTIDILNNTLLTLKENNNNINFSLNLYFKKINEQLFNLKEYLFNLMEIQKLSFDKNRLASININIKRFPLFIMLFSSIICLLFSSIYHLLRDISNNYHKILSKFDYAGISILIAGSCYPPYYYFFFCSQNLIIFYLSFITIFGLIVFFYTLLSDSHLSKNRKLRGILFLIFGISAGIPIIQMTFFKNTIKGYGIGPNILNWVLGGISYIIGALLYINRFPEKFFPGYFDIYGASHQLFHILVIFGVIFHYIASLEAFHYRINMVCYNS